MSLPAKQKPVLVSLVTRNDASDLERCLASLQAQRVPLRIKIFDNDSRDGTVKLARRFSVQVEPCRQNLGYSGGHNRNLTGEDFEHALLLNADVVLREDYVERLLVLFEQEPRVGMAGGKLLRMGEDGQVLQAGGRPVVDSTGIYFTPEQRHLDRGSGKPDGGEWDRRQRVFGISGAALLVSRAMLEDVRYGEEYLDEDFFAYREDADLAWRARLRGWEAVYEPAALALHRRRVLPQRRRSLPPFINYHSLKNRYLMRRKCMDRAVLRKCFPYLWLRDLGILAYVLVRERSSLAAYREVWRLRHRFSEKRRHVQASRIVPPEEIARWFSFRPVAFDL